MKLRGKAKAEFLARMKKGRLKAARKNPVKGKVKTRKTITKRQKTIAKKQPKRKTNPSHQQRLNGAVDLFRRFRGDDPEYIDRIKINVPKEAMAIGKLDGVLYTTVRDGKKEAYIHRFNGRSRPTLCSSWDGKQLFIVDGNYNFTEEGIVDVKPKTDGTATF